MALLPSPNLSFGRMRNLLQVVWVGMIGGLVVLSLAAFLLFGRLEPPEDPPSFALLLVGALLSVVTVALALALPRLLSAHEEAPVALRLQGAVYARLFGAAAVEGAGLYWAVLALLLGDPACFLGPVLALVYLLVSFPTTWRLEQAVGLSEEEIDRRLEGRTS